MPVIVLLWNNQGYGEIKTYMAERAIPQIGVDIFTPDFVAIAQGLRLRGRARGQLRASARRPRRRRSGRTVPTLIEIREDAPWLTA